VRAASLALLLCASAFGLARAQEPEVPALPIGASARGVTRKDAPAAFRFEAPSAGVITVLVQVEREGDLVLFVCDDDGEPLANLLDESGQAFPGARCDRDLLGSKGVETLTILLPSAGRYAAIVEVADLPEARFSISGAFAPAPELVRKPDPRAARARDAVVVPVGNNPTQAETTITPKEHDLRDWFSIRCERAGKLRVVLRAADGDLRLDVFAPGRLRAALASSDGDEQGVAGNESLTIDVQEGQVVLVRVGAVFVSADRIGYRLVAAITD
jgi:hypothetical protein